MILRVYLAEPRNRKHVMALFEALRSGWRSGMNIKYEGAASMGINGYRFSCKCYRALAAFAETLPQSVYQINNR